MIEIDEYEEKELVERMRDRMGKWMTKNRSKTKEIQIGDLKKKESLRFFAFHRHHRGFLILKFDKLTF